MNIQRHIVELSSNNACDGNATILFVLIIFGVNVANNDIKVFGFVIQK
jgi:hypothetical protein